MTTLYADKVKQYI